MNTASIQLKLAQLRMKTDQELALVIDKSLESALHLLDLGGQQRLRAQKSCDEAVRLLPIVDNLRERRRLQSKLAQVRQRMDRVSAAQAPRVQMACS